VRALLLIWLSLAAACSTPASAVLASRSSAPTPSAAGTTFPDRASSTPPGADTCQAASEVEAVLAQFASAFNAGDAEAIRAVLSSEFWALSLTLGGQNETAYGRDDAVRYVMQRQRAGDRLEFVRVQVNELAGWDGAAQIGPVAFLLRRGATSTELQGKGALYCRGGARGIKVLAMADSGSTK
jgi:SnoaL-like domain